MNILVIGTGYVGLVTGVCFAEMGNNVCCVDVDEEKINRLNRLEIPIYEPQLEELMRENCKDNRLKFTTDIKKSVTEAEIVFIAVGTPANHDGSSNLSDVFSVARDIGKYMNRQLCIVDKSTVPVGTAEKVKSEIQKELEDRYNRKEIDKIPPFEIVSNPEFLREGSAISDCMRPDRIIIGADNERAINILKELYMPFIRNTENFITMDIKSAEMTKYAANSFLATKISFMNEMANICEKVGADINKVRIGIGSDTRIGYHYMYAGCGYGGSCFPKDIKALVKTSIDVGYEPSILKSVEFINNKQKKRLAEEVKNKFGSDLEGRTFGIWGLAFKPDTDDMREAPSTVVINELTKGGAKVNVYDPKAMEEAKEIYLKGNRDVKYYEDKYEAIKGVDAMILITEWKEFRSPDFTKMKKIMKNALIFDGRNQFDAEILKVHGFEYYQIGVRNLEVENMG